MRVNTQSQLFVSPYEMKPLAIFVSCYFVSAVHGGFTIPSGGNATNICKAELSQPANATGVQYYDSYKFQGSGLGLWRVAVSTNSSAATIEEGRELTEESPGAIADVWLDPFEGINLMDGDNGYSACAFIFKGLPYNTNLRGQKDDTSCTQMFSEKCVEAITWRAAETARWLVSSPTQGPFSNLTVSGLTTQEQADC